MAKYVFLEINETSGLADGGVEQELVVDVFTVLLNSVVELNGLGLFLPYVTALEASGYRGNILCPRIYTVKS